MPRRIPEGGREMAEVVEALPEKFHGERPGISKYGRYLDLYVQALPRAVSNGGA
ncbi:MAG: hypothetical protein NVSMB32_09190 [Actinomycetota bacterium]